MINSTKDLRPDMKVGDLEGWQFVSPVQQEANKNYGEKKRKPHKEREFVFMKKDFFSQVKADLSFGEAGLLLFLARYMKIYDDGKLTHKGKRITVSEIAKLIGKSDRQVRTILDKLEKRSLIYKMKEGRSVYVDLSDELFVCGSLNGADIKTVKVFKVKLAEVAKELTLNELGLFMLMLENVHWETHVLCENPDERETNKLVLWRRKDACEALGVGRNFLNSTLNKLGGIKVIAEVKTVNEGIVLRPEIVSRRPSTPSWDTIVDTIDNGLTKDNYKK